MSRKKVICLILILIDIVAMVIYYFVNNSDGNNEKMTNNSKGMSILSFGDTEYDGFNDIKATDDGYIAVGYTSKANEQDKHDVIYDGVIVKYDKNKKIVFEKKYSTGSDVAFEGIALSKDGYVVVGNEKSFDEIDVSGISNAFIVKYDFNGNVIWNKKFNTTTYNSFNKIISINDGYIVVGSTHIIEKVLYECLSNGPHEGDEEESTEEDHDYKGDEEDSCTYDDAGKDNALIVKYDLNGNILFQKEFDDKDNREKFNSVAILSDGYIAVGSSYNDDDNYSLYNAIAVKYDFNGKVVWSKNYSDSKFSTFNDVIAVKDSNYKDSFVVVGAAFNPNSEYDTCSLMARIDDKGKIGFNVQHCSTLESKIVNSELLSVNEDNNEFIAVGYSGSGDNSNVIVSKNTIEGVSSFEISYDYFKFYQPTIKILSNNGDYVIVGTTERKEDSKYANLFDDNYDGFILFDSVK